MTGRFLQVDPIIGGSANSYDYCNADPINSADPSGTSPLNTWIYVGAKNYGGVNLGSVSVNPEDDLLVNAYDLVVGSLAGVAGCCWSYKFQLQRRYIVKTYKYQWADHCSDGSPLRSNMCPLSVRGRVVYKVKYKYQLVWQYRARGNATGYLRLTKLKTTIWSPWAYDDVHTRWYNYNPHG